MTLLEIKKRTSPSHADYHNNTSALQELADIASVINTTSHHLSNHEKHGYLSSETEGLQGRYCGTNRHLVGEYNGDVMISSYLCSDIASFTIDDITGLIPSSPSSTSLSSSRIRDKYIYMMNDMMLIIQDNKRLLRLSLK
jgi:hypothetical protein